MIWTFANRGLWAAPRYLDGHLKDEVGGCQSLIQICTIAVNPNPLNNFVLEENRSRIPWLTQLLQTWPPRPRRQTFYTPLTTNFTPPASCFSNIYANGSGPK
jgi:hypothetical protein